MNGGFMRRCALVCLLAIPLFLNGCGLFAWLYEKPKGGGDSPATVAQQVVKGIPLWGDAISALIGIGGTIYGVNRHKAHRKTHKENAVLKARATPPAPQA